MRVVQHHKLAFAVRNSHVDAIGNGHTGILDGYSVHFCATLSLFFCGLRMMETSMGDVVNLNRARKRAARETAAKQADANRARFGRSKSERAQEEQRSERAKAQLDQHRLDDGEAS